MNNIIDKYVEHGNFKGNIKVAIVQFNEDYNNQIIDLIKKYPKNFVRMIMSKAVHKDKAIDRRYLLDYILQSTPLLQDPFYTLKTKIYWVINKMTTFPWCLNDTDESHQMIKNNIKNIKDGYGKYCNTNCQHKSKSFFDGIKLSLSKKYGDGIVNPFQLESVKWNLKLRKDEIEQKKKLTRKQHFGDDPGWNLKQSILTRKKLYGNTWNIEKIKQSKQQKYGDPNWNNSQQNFRTRKQNNTMSTSSHEDIVYQILCDHFGEASIERQFYSDKYPFHCDFYIKDFDLYIECNFSWTHGGHWFNECNEEDQKILKKWKAKNTKYYDNAICTWTNRDLQKKTISEQNKLNYLVFWNINEAKMTLNNKIFYDNLIKTISKSIKG